MNIENSIFLKALNKEKLSTPPIWYMRQAGRYMPEYRAVRKNFKNFLDMCKNPEVCCELALQPINAFNLDAAILFSDILTIPDALGLGVKFLEGEGPVFDNPIKISKDVINLPDFEPDNLSYVYKAVSNIKNALPKNIPLIGFSGSPWTLAAYSIEGRSSKNFEYTKSFIRNNEEEAHIFLQKLTDACFIYLKKQVEAGADVIQIFDSWANLLSKKDYETYSLNYIRSLISKLKEDQVTASIPIILFAREPEISCNHMVKVQADCLSLYWKTKDIDLAFLNGKVALQGNLNPEILLQEDNVIKNEADRILKQFKNYDGYVFNLGHGITPNIDPGKIKLLTDHIRSR
ncbi:uroporphyrinogen decarboxylase [Gammaproteobacteria bacterium]|jgi:uroporphyrinogen decarboxylase|nr:uroporphyrinogen decarboxylase [Gammaproteobacteria bacterium]MDA8541153.1 uroporphyrinogen decarboxylase [Gammaproteobacteria bacterium]MDA8733497.1 uroporphyrinogen decarboxylase [Gammaproteobacteria bacterium]MDA8917036.1 uroporphyrinogen decarboxylase [Gammaproteobacteria bacterium]MDA9867008.1 uroporphyrinogen decarboxylase [Gammaproteobacteria bacterium]|tara:strand:+ start:43 stop:1080 length:1038 start_codon:yes stop_codon:yes gene_type:complete